MKLVSTIKALYYWIYAKVILIFHYDKKYVQGRFFEGSYRGIFAIGWKWIVTDYKQCKRQGVNLTTRYPVSAFNTVVYPENIEFHPNDLNMFQGFGKYFQARGRISIGKGSYIAPNVGLITANHEIGNLDNHQPPKEIVIGNCCWIGMNSVILPGVMLGDNTIVGAGSVVTKSFQEGHCIIAGNPAKLIRNLRDE